jgi:hypothetical protein
MGSHIKFKGKRRVQKSKKICMLLNDLPEGVTYIGDLADFNEEQLLLFAKMRQKELSCMPAHMIKLRPFNNDNDLSSEASRSE